MFHIPYSTQCISQDDIDAVAKVLNSEWLTQGPSVARFENLFASIHQCKHAIAVSNATAGLHIACLALGAKTGTRVWTSPNSFVASANAALYCGATIDFVDIDPVTRNMCVVALREKLELAKKNNSLPLIVIPVHFAGLPCDMRTIRALANEYKFRIIEDASHAVGAQYDGAPIGSRFADISIFSFHPVKIVTTGEGGIALTQDDTLAKRLRLLRSHGITRDSDDIECKEELSHAWYYEQHTLGFNYRLTDIQAALGESQLKRLDQLRASRMRLADRYDELLSKFPIKLPVRLDNSQSAWHLYVIQIDNNASSINRADVFNFMRDAGIGVNVHYIPIHLQPYYKNLGFKSGHFPNAENYYNGALSIPLYPHLTDAQQDEVVGLLARALNV